MSDKKQNRITVNEMDNGFVVIIHSLPTGHNPLGNGPSHELVANTKEEALDLIAKLAFPDAMRHLP